MVPVLKRRQKSEFAARGRDWRGLRGRIGKAGAGIGNEGRDDGIEEQANGKGCGAGGMSGNQAFLERLGVGLDKAVNGRQFAVTGEFARVAGPGKRTDEAGS